MHITMHIMLVNGNCNLVLFMCHTLICFSIHLALKVMTKPKARSCPNCGASNTANQKTCASCYVCLLQKKSFKEKETAVRTGNWGQNTLKHRNGARVVASAHVACNLLCIFQVSKLAALGYNPILFIGKKKKKGVNTVNAEMITYMCPGGDGPVKPFLEKMSTAYEYIIKIYLLSLPTLFSSSSSRPFHLSPIYFSSPNGP
ncbi:uncharacterized protein LOC118336559 [Morone saxatilis]|uniref:uncharacterized protein LOC118336559 n=1 Tax=Morone saxatilis TaxID=34816 RepID=UPI0015E1D856|nr:uncharacterized protein LOC118336559 [Morone saxatilis]